MNLSLTKNKEQKEGVVEVLNSTGDCKVSNASTELMLDRFCNGKRIEFPFSQ